MENQSALQTAESAAEVRAEAKRRRADARARRKSDPLYRQKRKELPWILYDVGNSAFTLLVSAILPIYFNALVTGAGLSGTDATAIWGYAASGVTLCVAVISPILGSFTDYKGMKKQCLTPADCPRRCALKMALVAAYMRTNLLLSLVLCACLFKISV